MNMILWGWQVFHHVLDSHDCMLIIASDGVWDSVRPGEAVKVAAEKAYDGARHAAQELVEHAFQYSKAEHPTRGHDNTTAIVFLY
jgi:serine/threonine protein phosphatase PrpC